MKSFWIGIDPGVNGAIAVLTLGFSQPYINELEKSTPKESFQFLVGIRDMYGDPNAGFAFLENVSSSPQQGVRSAFTFGRGYGTLEGFLTALDVPFDRVTPRRWQKSMSCLSKGDKNVTKRRAQELFPKVRVTHAIADALLIAEHCRRTHFGLSN